MKKKLIYIILFVFAAGAVLWFFKDINQQIFGAISESIGSMRGKTVVILSQTKTKAIFKVEIADSQEERSQGLSGRKSLGRNEGMLFIFPEPGLYTFWMKEMRFSLDFVWISGNKVVDMIENVPYPADASYLNLPQYSPNQPVDKVLEINAGMIEKYNIKIGDEFEFK